ncbi:MAG: methyltransferase domain-containing protein [Thermodesulfobacteriota bacterium]|nr:methyltransferase domain-containing protein [Thermodesulfobacteriota bacterium]
MFKKDIFITGEYSQLFKPDDNRNPFRKIYYRKKQDTISIISKLEKNRTVLDIGGGMGRISSTLVKSTGNNIILSDISIHMLRLAVDHKESSNSFKVLNADAHQLPLQDSSFDVVVALDLLCHLTFPEKALSEFYRVLNNQGTLIIDSTNSNPLWTLFYPRYLGKNPLNWFKIIKFQGILPEWKNIVKHYPKKHFFYLLRNSGFKVVRNINYGPAMCPKWHLSVSKKYRHCAYYENFIG